MADTQLTLTSEDHEFLVELLERTLKDTRVEEHRTRSPNYRQGVLHREDLIVGLLKQLGRPSP